MLLRNWVCAFLMNDDKYLLMKRNPNRSFSPNYWSGIGGKIEPLEINDPLRACYREIEEETCISKDQIESINLLYIITRNRGKEIYQSYIYFGDTKVSETASNVGDSTLTEEGLLYWIPTEELLQLEFTVTYKVMIEHYLARDMNDRDIYLGAVGTEAERLNINWTRLANIDI